MYDVPARPPRGSKVKGQVKRKVYLPNAFLFLEGNGYLLPQVRASIPIELNRYTIPQEPSGVTRWDDAHHPRKSCEKGSL